MSADDRPDIIREFHEAGLHVQEITGDDLSELLGGGLGDLLNGLLDGALDHLLAQAVPTMRYPKRNSAEYREMMQSGLECRDLNGIIAGIRQVREGYGWIGWVDFCMALIKAMEKHTPAEARNAYGHVRLDKILRTDHDEAELMETAVHIANSKEGPEQGYTFTSALDAGMEIVRTVDSWFPGIQQALACAHARDDAGIRAALAALPDMKCNDPERLSMTTQGVLVLAMAHMAVARPDNCLEEYDKHV